MPRDNGQTRDEFALAHPIRRRLVAEVKRLPGIRLHELASLVGQTASSLKWHMQILVKARRVSMHLVGQARFFTPPGLLPEAVRLAAATSGLRMYRRRDALALLTSHPTLTATDAALGLGVSTGAARNALDYLVAQGLAESVRPGRAASYELSGFGRRVAALPR